MKRLLRRVPVNANGPFLIVHRLHDHKMSNQLGDEPYCDNQHEEADRSSRKVSYNPIPATVFRFLIRHELPFGRFTFE